MSAIGAGHDQNATPIDLERLADLIESVEGVAKVIRMHALPLDGGDLLVTVKVALDSDKALTQVADDIETIKQTARDFTPKARIVVVEPDIYRPSIDPQPPTDVFVLRSAD